MNKEHFLEVGYCQVAKFGEGAEGDVFSSKKTEDGRLLSVLSDGLGSGIKAGVLANLTASMALKFITEDIPVERAAGIIMQTLPVCKQRKISYATFTIVDIDSDNSVRIIEYDNPPYLLIREDTNIEPIKSCIELSETPIFKGQPRAPNPARMNYSSFQARPGDRVLFFSDGITQSGMGSKRLPLGWGAVAAQEHALRLVRENQAISARELARKMVKEAEAHDAYQAKDDITCGVVYFRRPRQLLIVSGPSIDAQRDAEMAAQFTSFTGQKIICGGTTAAILSRETGAPVRVSLKGCDPSMPPASIMDGADLVTEGIITLGKVAEMLEYATILERNKNSPAGRLVDLLLDSDQIQFLVGTRINEAHQDPTMPMELEIRRNVIKKIAALLQERHLKETSIRYI